MAFDTDDCEVLNSRSGFQDRQVSFCLSCNHIQQDKGGTFKVVALIFRKRMTPIHPSTVSLLLTIAGVWKKRSMTHSYGLPLLAQVVTKLLCDSIGQWFPNAQTVKKKSATS